MAAGFREYVQNAQDVRELLANFYGTPFVTQPVEADFTINTSAVGVLQLVLQRVGALVQNTGATNIYIGYSQAVSTSTGFKLSPGDRFREDWYYDGDLLMRQLYCVGDNSGGSVHVLERCLQGV